MKIIGNVAPLIDDRFPWVGHRTIAEGRQTEVLLHMRRTAPYCMTPADKSRLAVLLRKAKIANGGQRSRRGTPPAAG